MDQWVNSPNPGPISGKSVYRLSTLAVWAVCVYALASHFHFGVHINRLEQTLAVWVVLLTLRNTESCLFLPWLVFWLSAKVKSQSQNPCKQTEQAGATLQQQLTCILCGQPGRFVLGLELVTLVWLRIYFGLRQTGFKSKINQLRNNKCVYEWLTSGRSQPCSWSCWWTGDSSFQSRVTADTPALSFLKSHAG